MKTILIQLLLPALVVGQQSCISQADSALYVQPKLEKVPKTLLPGTPVVRLDIDTTWYLARDTAMFDYFFAKQLGRKMFINDSMCHYSLGVSKKSGYGILSIRQGSKLVEDFIISPEKEILHGRYFGLFKNAPQLRAQFAKGRIHGVLLLLEYHQFDPTPDIQVVKYRRGYPRRILFTFNKKFRKTWRALPYPPYDLIVM